jgi:hypothetical protein
LHPAVSADVRSAMATGHRAQSDDSPPTERKPGLAMQEDLARRGFENGLSDGFMQSAIQDV